MTGVWLGENDVPLLTEVSEDLYRFEHPIRRGVWPGAIIVFLAILFCSTICLPLVLYLENPIHRIASAAIGVVFVVAIANAVWGTTGRTIDTRLRKVRVAYYILGRETWTRQYDIASGDFIAIETGGDDHGTGGYHYVYLCRSTPLFLFAAIHLPSSKGSDRLVQACDEIASKLGIENRGYIGSIGFLRLWMNRIVGKN
ncbi:MAG: hypothetical protein MUC83_02835 [Pirellula sp.]|jgi:hypothetical protein|nr:hypothetical protein [Pirellula sp.]